ncbi:MAG: alanine racemase [Deltaproteobacteria bacterium]|nr:alanine racemase [Deltaproteobacteria bacterium]
MVSSFSDFLRPTCAVIDLAALASNFDRLRSSLPEGCGMLCMVKADAYGHGAVAVSRKLVSLGTTALGVATVEEGCELRDAGVKAPILVMGGLLGMGTAAIKVMLEADLTPVVHSAQVIDALNEATRTTGKKVAVHLKIDTGMGRLGVRPEVLPTVMDHLKRASHLVLEGVMTHLAKVWEEAYTAMQVEHYQAATRLIEKELGPIPIRHVANSVASLQNDPVKLGDTGTWWARPGIALYGSTAGALSDVKLSPVMSLHSRVALVKWIPIGAKVSYACEFTARRKTRLGVVPIGYADGYPWRLTGKAYVIVREKLVPVIGRVTMDMIMVDLTDIDSASVSDEVILMGQQGNLAITVDQVSEWAGTIPYEVMCGVSKRIPRIYKG